MTFCFPKKVMKLRLTTSRKYLRKREKDRFKLMKNLTEILTNGCRKRFLRNNIRYSPLFRLFVKLKNGVMKEKIKAIKFNDYLIAEISFVPKIDT